jgi:hypothetical protein
MDTDPNGFSTQKFFFTVLNKVFKYFQQRICSTGTFIHGSSRRIIYPQRLLTLQKKHQIFAPPAFSKPIIVPFDPKNKCAISDTVDYDETLYKRKLCAVYGTGTSIGPRSEASFSISLRLLHLEPVF